MTTSMASPEPVLSVRNLTVDFALKNGPFRAVDGVSFDIMPGEVLGVIGESGAGKSMTGSAIIGLVDPPGRISGGEVWLGGRRIDDLPPEDLAKLRGGRIGMVFQDPLTSLNPLHTIGRQLVETIRRHLPLSEEEARARAVLLLSEAGIPDPAGRLHAYPHQFSGGMRQRVVIALALAGEPELVIADEPTSALDVSVQAQIIRVLKKLCESRGVAVMLVTHDMGVVAETADRMIVMNRGRVVESGDVRQVIRAPRERYTIALVDAIPSIRDAARPPREAETAQPLVRVEALSREFDLSRGGLAGLVGKRGPVLKAVDGVSFEILRGTTFGLVGESGSGKSTCARMMVGLTRPTAGRIVVDGKDVWDGTRRRGRGRTQMIFQDPYASLNPRWRVADIVAEPMRALKLVSGRCETQERVAHLLGRVRMDASAMRKFPHEFSGGQRQRIAIARALSSQPEFIVCDEPTSALDVSVQAQVLDLMAELQAEFGLTYLLISHNLAVVRRMSDRVGVMRGGVMVEQGTVREVFDAPSADYTRMLLQAVPDISAIREAKAERTTW